MQIVLINALTFHWVSSQCKLERHDIEVIYADTGTSYRMPGSLVLKLNYPCLTEMDALYFPDVAISYSTVLVTVYCW
jgi:hypothetical protein